MWPPKNGLETPTVAREAAVLTLSASTHVKAPASLVFEILRRPSSYGDWNTWCPKVTIEAPNGEQNPPEESLRLDKGTIFTFHVIMDASKPSSTTATRLLVTDVSRPESQSSYIPAEELERNGETYTADLGRVYRISWKSEGGFAAKGLKSERFHEVIVLGECECEVRTWEVMGGLLAHTVKWVYKNTLQEKFKLWCSDLKKEGERVVEEGKT